MSQTEAPMTPGWGIRLISHGLAVALLLSVALFGAGLIAGAIDMADRGTGPVWVAVMLIFAGSVLVAAGLGLIYSCYFASIVRARRQRAILLRYPDQPWMLRADWAEGRLIDNQIGKVVLVWTVLAGWSVGGAIVGYHNHAQILDGMRGVAAWVAGGFMLLMFATIVKLTCQLTRAWWRLGDGVLMLDTVPGRLGGRFIAQLATRLSDPPADGLEIDVRCVLLRANRQDEDGEHVLWREDWIVPPEQMRSTSGGTLVPVSFDVPRSLPESGRAPDGDVVVWRLRIASLKRSEVFVLFHWDIPIFAAERGC